MRINLDDDHIIGIEMGPLIDCVFLLLIFFLVATTLKKPEEIQPQLQVAEQVQEEIIEEIDIDKEWKDLHQIEDEISKVEGKIEGYLKEIR